MHYFIPHLKHSFHQEKMKPLSFLWFLRRHPAGSSRQFAICHRMVASQTHTSAGELFVFWNLHSAPSGYSWHPKLAHWSNKGCLQSSLHFPKCKICGFVGLALTQKNFSSLPPPLKYLSQLAAAMSYQEDTNSFSQAQCLQNCSSMATGYFLPTSVLGSSFPGPFLSAVEVPTGDMP